MDNTYFGPVEEEKYRDFIKETDPVKKNRIYNQYLKEPFIKMTECIVRRYELYTPNERFEDTVNDIISYLITVADKYDPTKCKRAFSYCQTIVRNTALAKRVGEYKRSLRESPIESHWSIGNSFNDDDQVYHDGEISSIHGTDLLDNDSENADFSLNNENDNTLDNIEHDDYVTRVFVKMVDQIKDMVDDPGEYNLTEDEIKVGRALVYCMESWHNILPEQTTVKCTKNMLLYGLRENTLLDEAKIRKALQRYKDIYKTVAEVICRRSIY